MDLVTRARIVFLPSFQSSYAKLSQGAAGCSFRLNRHKPEWYRSSPLNLDKATIFLIMLNYSCNLHASCFLTCKSSNHPLLYIFTFILSERLKPITNIRIVLVGAKGSGKTSSLNTILSRESSQSLRRTALCLVGKGVVFGRQVTVVDTPGWWMNYFSDESAIFDRMEMVFSLSLCPPGPHVFLLVIRVDRAFTETYRRAVQEHLQLISENIWSRVIVLFSFGDWLGGATTEQWIESEGEPLQWLVDRCGNRYHVLNNKTKGDGFQVRELIGKIEEMLAGCNDGQHYEVERKVMEQLEVKMRQEKERAKERLMRKQKQRQLARSQLGELGTFKSD